MKPFAFLRSIAALFVIVCLLTTPILATTGVAGKGDKNFKQGLKYEVAEQWDKAAEEFALAVAANPGNSEYRLHYRRALFNASQMMVMRGRTLAEQKDYVGAYNAFRQAYGYDPTNELAKAEMERMIRLQQGTADPNDPNKPKDSPASASPGVKLVPTAYNPNAAASTQPPVQDTPQLEQLRDLRYTKVDLKTVVKDLAQSLDLNVIFDSETFRTPKDLTIELKNVTTAQALDYIFLQENLFFQRVGKRAVLVAHQNQRQRFQQLVLRTFYLQNAKPEDVARTLPQALPPQPGRAPLQPIVDKDTNSITVRDTTENIKILANFIKALDKDRAEVVMDVNIYEVSKNDLLQLGAQLGSEASLTNLGGSNTGVIGSGNFGQVSNGNGGTISLPRAIATGINIPALSVSAFQSKTNARVLASTQVHAFNNEESQARIGQRVPVRTAQLLGYNTGNGTPNNSNNFNNLNNAASVYNYEQVGLTLKFTPVVFPNQDVQVKMSIESKDVAAGGVDNNPTFTERTITGTARIQNNRTLLLASVAQDSQSNGRQGIPFLGLIPVLGRVFSTPRTDNRQVDIVIAVTPRVLRAPSITPEDEVEQPTGSIAVPTNSSLAEMIRQEDREDQIAAARRIPNTVVVQLPDEKPDQQLRTAQSASGDVPLTNGAKITLGANPTVNTTAIPPVPTPSPAPPVQPTTTLVPNGEKPTGNVPNNLQLNNLVESPVESDGVQKKVTRPSLAPSPAARSGQVAPDFTVINTAQTETSSVKPLNGESTTKKIGAKAVESKTPLDPIPVEVKIQPLGEMSKGEKRRVSVIINAPSALQTAVLSLRFDASQIAVTKVAYGDVFGKKMMQTEAPPFTCYINKSDGMLIASLPLLPNQLAQGSGVLAYVEVEALANGTANLEVNSSNSSLIGINGENLVASR